jgi:hypothetical protein
MVARCVVEDRRVRAVGRKRRRVRNGRVERM